MTRSKHLAICAALALSVVTVTEARAQGDVDNTAYGTTSAEFLLLGAGARGAALGGSFAAIADDATALYWNPAGVALMTRPSLAVSTYDYLVNTRYNWIGIAFPFGGGERAVGFHAASFGFSDQPVYTLEDPEGNGETYSVSEVYVGLTYSQNFSDRFSAGLTAKVISDKLGRANGLAAAIDFGTNFHASIGPRPIRASFVIQNLGSTLGHDGSGLDVTVTRDAPTGVDDLPQEAAAARLRTKDFPLPIVFRVGLAYDVFNTTASRVTLMSEFTQPNNSRPTANGALEWALTDIGQTGFSLVGRGSYTYQSDNNLDPTGAAGFTTDLDSSNNMDGLAVGGGLAFHRGTFGIAVDYAYRDLGILGGTNFFSASISW